MAYLLSFYLIASIWIGICAIISIIISFSVVYCLCIKDSTEWINKSYRNLTIVTILLFSVVCIGDCIHILIRFTNFPDLNKFDDSEILMIITIASIYYFANFMFYVLLLHRIYVAFYITKLVVGILSTLIMIIGLSSAAVCFLAFIIFNNRVMHPEEPDVLNKYVTHILYILCITDLILNLSFILIFWYKLRSTIIDSYIMSIDHQKHINLAASMIIKNSLLFGIAIFAHQTLFAWLVYLWAEDIGMDDDHELIMTYMVYVLRSNDIVINISVLWLILRVNYNQYICLCKYCHLCVGKCCIKDYKVGTDNPYTQMQTL